MNNIVNNLVYRGERLLTCRPHGTRYIVYNSSTQEVTCEDVERIEKVTKFVD